MYTCSHLVSWKPPASQFNIDVSSPNFFEESIINEIIEFKKVETARPESINEELEELDANLDIRKTIKAQLVVCNTVYYLRNRLFTE